MYPPLTVTPACRARLAALGIVYVLTMGACGAIKVIEPVETLGAGSTPQQRGRNGDFVPLRGPGVGKADAHPSYCGGHCGGKSPHKDCYCDDSCLQNGDCCYDFMPQCKGKPGSCVVAGVNYCGGESIHGCYCDDECASHGDCCADNAQICGNADSPRTSCAHNNDCGPTEYCQKKKGDCHAQGKCAVRPDATIALYSPVCGCDDITYGNSGKAAMNGVNVKSEGACATTPNGNLARSTCAKMRTAYKDILEVARQCLPAMGVECEVLVQRDLACQSHTAPATTWVPKHLASALTALAASWKVSCGGHAFTCSGVIQVAPPSSGRCVDPAGSETRVSGVCAHKN